MPPACQVYYEITQNKVQYLEPCHVVLDVVSMDHGDMNNYCFIHRHHRRHQDTLFA